MRLQYLFQLGSKAKLALATLQSQSVGFYRFSGKFITPTDVKPSKHGSICSPCTPGARVYDPSSNSRIQGADFILEYSFHH